jgi:vancomycin resistance protein YoaR
VVLLAVGERALAGGDVLHGVRVRGVPVAGRDVDDARAAIAAHARRLEGARFQAVAAGTELTFTAGDVGLVVNEAEAVAAVERAGRKGNPIAQVVGAVLRRFRPDRVSLDVTYDPKKLDRTIEAWAERIDAEPRDGAVSLENGAVAVTDPRPGRRLDKRATALLVRKALAGSLPSPLTLPVDLTPPAVGDDQVAVVAEPARRILSAPVTVTVEGRAATLSPARLGDMLAVVNEERSLRLELPPEPLHEALRPQLQGVEIPARDARFVIERPPPPPPAAAAPPADPAAPAPPPAPPAPPPPPVIRIEPSAVGRELDIGPVADAVLRGEHRITGQLVDAVPRIDTARAETLRITEPVATFTTHHPAGQPRVKNIHRIADMLQGTVILPGERFSMNETVGPRTKANGFVKAPVIYEGEFTEDIGGGVSQFATTFFNAAFFGGYELVSHKAHTYYISRYPQGREATISFPQPDLVIRNDSNSGILVETAYTASSITVTFWGDKEGRTVRAEGPRIGKRTSKGYSVTVVRVIERPGAEPVRQNIVTQYRIQPKKA